MSSGWYWVPALLILLGSAIALVIMTVSRFQNNPTYMVQIDKTFTVRQFPSVILCPSISFMEDRMTRFLDSLRYPYGMNASITRKMLPQLGAFFSPDVPYNVPDLVRVEQLLNYNGIDVETAGRLLTASCEETLIKCRWGKIYMNCSDIFQMELTGDGFCCVFNGRSLRRYGTQANIVQHETYSQVVFDHREVANLTHIISSLSHRGGWKLTVKEMEDGITDIQKTQLDKHWYSKRFGYTSGLILAVDQSQEPLNIDLSYKWIALQTSQHFADTTTNGTALNPGTEQWIAYYTKDFQITMGAKALSAKLRRCNMLNDKLQYFPIYNKRYCLLEYEMANTLRRCQCVRMVHPRPPGTSRCQAQMLICAKQAMVAYNNVNFQCPQTCEVEIVTTKASSIELDPKVTPIDTFYNGLNFSRVTVVRVFIQHRKQYTKERWSTYGYLDLFAQLGGMFGVFLGCSVLTLLSLLQLGYRIVKTQWQRFWN